MQKFRLYLGLLLLLFFGGIFAGGQTTVDQADLVITNGRIHTMSEFIPEVQALAVKGGKILALGNNEDIKPYIGTETKVLDVKRKLVLPGFIDSHCHFVSGGQSLGRLDMGGATSVAAIQQQIADRIKELPEGAPVIGYASYPNNSLYPGLGWPDKTILDKVSPKNPVVILRRGGHALWLNSLALEKSGITGDTPSPEDGEVVKDPETGEPTGILKEMASGLNKVWEPSDLKGDIKRALAHAAGLGITGIHTSTGPRTREAFAELKKAGELTLRVYAWLDDSSLDDHIAAGIKTGQGDEWIRIGLVKMYIDGTIGVRTALMFEPFTEEPGNTGIPIHKEEDFYAQVDKAHANDLQVGVHAIGDRAVHWVLNAYEKAQQAHGRKGLRHRVEHCTVCTIEDARRLGSLGVIPSTQPNITGGELYRKIRLGEERTRRVDMWRTFLNHGAVPAWGTDWPVSPLNPLLNIQQVVTRYYPEQRLTIYEAVRYYTYGGAYASHEEDIKGTLDVGKLADMVVLSRNLFTIKPQDIPKTEVLYTIVGGKIVYQKSH